MSDYIYTDISCTKADQGRLKTAIALIKELRDGGKPATLPPKLKGCVDSVAEFEERFAGYGDLAYFEYDESPDSIFIDDDDIDVDGLAELFRTCLVDSLPMSLSWVRDGGLGGASAIFADRVRRATTVDLERLLLEEGARKARAATA